MSFVLYDAGRSGKTVLVSTSCVACLKVGAGAIPADGSETGCDRIDMKGSGSDVFAED